MAPPPPGPYSGTSTLALVARVSAFSFGLVYGSIKLKYLKVFYRIPRSVQCIRSLGVAMHLAL
ncbi:hypothetical protein SESBI_51174 [Sesbania bispinosa]|nr:hypothetical protein SESBI_51174 [Sesbania bispinosa]